MNVGRDRTETDRGGVRRESRDEMCPASLPGDLVQFVPLRLADKTIVALRLDAIKKNQEIRVGV